MQRFFPALAAVDLTTAAPRPAAAGAAAAAPGELAAAPSPRLPSAARRAVRRANPNPNQN